MFGSFVCSFARVGWSMLAQGGGNEQRVSVKDEMLLFEFLLFVLLSVAMALFLSAFWSIRLTVTLDYSSLSLSLCQRTACCAAILDAEHGPDMIRRVLLLKTRGCEYHLTFFSCAFCSLVLIRLRNGGLAWRKRTNKGKTTWWINNLPSSPSFP